MNPGARHRAVVLFTITMLLMGTGTVFAQTPSEEEPLYERLGGLASIALVVSDFVDVFIEDSLIMENLAVRERKTPDGAPYVKYQVTSLVCEATGGPCQYTGLDMRTAHEGLNVTEREWDRMVEIFIGVLEDHRVPQRETEELLGILGPSKDDIVITEGGS